jgi:hypothetical protein
MPPYGLRKETHAFQMSREVTLGHEPRDDGLLELGGSRVKGMGSEGEGLDEPVRNDQVA